MKILNVLYSGLGGHGNVFFSLVDADKQKEFQFEAIFNGIEEVKNEYKEKCVRYNIPLQSVLKKQGLDFGYYLKLVKKIRESEAEVVFLHSSAYILPAFISNLFSRKKKRIIVRETQANQLKTTLEWIWLSVVLLFANKIIFLSEAYKKEISSRLRWIYNANKIQVVPNGINLDLYKPSHNMNTGINVIGMQSRLINIKDHITLLRAFALLLDNLENNAGKIILKIAGDGSYKDELLKETSALGIDASVIFTGMLPEKELIEFLNSLDIYVHASLGETMSTAIMQAMATGLPMVASDVPGINNMIKNNENGLLVPVKDPVALMLALKTLLTDELLSQKLGKNARLYAEQHYSNDTMFSAYKEIFHNR